MRASSVSWESVSVHVCPVGGCVCLFLYPESVCLSCVLCVCASVMWESVCLSCTLAECVALLCFVRVCVSLLCRGRV